MRPSASISATAVTRTIGLVASAPVTAIDIDVAMRQVAGPNRGAAGADPEIDRDMDLAALHVLADRPFAIARHRTALGGGHLDRDEFLGALAVARELLCQINRHRSERATEIGKAGIAGICDRGILRLARRAEQHRVARRGI